MLTFLIIYGAIGAFYATGNFMWDRVKYQHTFNWYFYFFDFLLWPIPVFYAVKGD